MKARGMAPSAGAAVSRTSRVTLGVGRWSGGVTGALTSAPMPIMTMPATKDERICTRISPPTRWVAPVTRTAPPKSSNLQKTIAVGFDAWMACTISAGSTASVRSNIKRLSRCLMRRGIGAINTLATPGGKFRHSIERMDPAHYLSSPYYEHWLTGVSTLAVEAGLTTPEDLERRAGGRFPLSRPDRG